MCQDFIEACQNGDYEAVENLLNQINNPSSVKKVINYINDYSNTPLHWACENGYEKVAELLIANGADIQISGNNGNTPLHYASMKGRFRIVELLISNGANVNAKDEDGRIPLHRSSWDGYYHATKLLIAAGADVNANDGNNDTPLHFAAFNYFTSSNEHEKIVKLLIDKGANVNAVNKIGLSPLHSVSAKRIQDKIGIAKLLVNAGSIVNSIDKNGLSPLHYASENGHDRIAELLIAEGAKINLTANDGSTPLHYAMHAKYGEKVVKLLISKGAKINRKDHDGNTPLAIANINGNSKTLNILKTKQHFFFISPLTSKLNLLMNNLKSKFISLCSNVSNRSTISSHTIRWYEQMSSDELIEELVRLCQKGYNWALKNGFCVVEDYPQYKAIREIGKRIYEIEGNEGMVKACHILRERVHVREGGGQYLAEHSWRGIGGWMP